MRQQAFGRRPLAAGVVLALAATVSGCLAPAGTSPVVERRGLKRTYSVPRVKPEASPDGFQFTTPHFLLTFTPEVAAMGGYQTAPERTSRGLGAMLALESQYNFLNEVLGVEPEAEIKIMVAPHIQGDEHDAWTRVGWGRDAQGKVQYRIAVAFGAEAFKDPATRAHEMTHAFTSVYGIPAWLSEGFAVLVEGELAGGAWWAKGNRSLKPPGMTADGRNVIQVWRTAQGEALLPFRSLETYAHSYSIVAELRDRYGDPFWKRFFQLLRDDLQANGPREHSDAEIAALMSRAAGRDLTPFFTGELSFRLDAAPLPRVVPSSAPTGNADAPAAR